MKRLFGGCFIVIQIKLKPATVSRSGSCEAHQGLRLAFNWLTTGLAFTSQSLIHSTAIAAVQKRNNGEIVSFVDRTLRANVALVDEMLCVVSGLWPRGHACLIIHSFCIDVSADWPLPIFTVRNS
jgi:hypothetical protein